MKAAEHPKSVAARMAQSFLDDEAPPTKSATERTDERYRSHIDVEGLYPHSGRLASDRHPRSHGESRRSQLFSRARPRELLRSLRARNAWGQSLLRDQRTAHHVATARGVGQLRAASRSSGSTFGAPSGFFRRRSSISRAWRCSALSVCSPWCARSSSPPRSSFATISPPILGAHGAGFFTSHYWSLGVEEHFYLFWPALLLFAGRKRALPVAITIAVLIAVVAARGGVARDHALQRDSADVFRALGHANRLDHVGRGRGAGAFASRKFARWSSDISVLWYISHSSRCTA